MRPRVNPHASHHRVCDRCPGGLPEPASVPVLPHSEYDPDGDEVMDDEVELGEEGEEGADANGGDGVIEIDAPGDGSSGEAVSAADRITTPYMTRFERARVLGTRALQIRCPPGLAHACSHACGERTPRAGGSRLTLPLSPQHERSGDG